MEKLTETAGAAEGAARTAEENMENKMASVKSTVNARRLLFVFIGLTLRLYLRI
jgi:hypothetical protein